MGRTKTAGWVGATVVLCVLLLAVAWFVAISPKLAAAGSARDQTESVEQQNAALGLRIDELRTQFARLDDYRAELAALRVAMPPTPELPELIDQVAAIAKKHDVFIGEIATETPMAVVPPESPVPAEPEPAPEEDAVDEGTDAGDSTGPDTEPGTDATPASTEPAAAAAQAVIEGFVVLPVRFTVYGEYADVHAFLGTVQTEIERLYLVTSLAGTSLRAEPARNGLPAFDTGDVELVIEGFAYVLQDETTETSEDETGRPDLPRGSERNPFDPVGSPIGGPGGDDDES